MPGRTFARAIALAAITESPMAVTCAPTTLLVAAAGAGMTSWSVSCRAACARVAALTRSPLMTLRSRPDQGSPRPGPPPHSAPTDIQPCHYQRDQAEGTARPATAAARCRCAFLQHGPALLSECRISRRAQLNANARLVNIAAGHLDVAPIARRR